MSETSKPVAASATKSEVKDASGALSKQLAENNKATPKATTKPAAKKPATKAKPAPRKAPSKPGARKTASKPATTPKSSGETVMATAKQDSAKQAFETMTAASNDAVKEGFEKSLTALNEFSAFQKDGVDALIASATATSKSLEEMNASAVEFAKKSMEDSVAAAKSFSSAKSVQELIEIQADYAKSSFDAYVGEVNKHTDLVSALFKDGFKPLNDQFTAAVEAMQSQR